MYGSDLEMEDGFFLDLDEEALDTSKDEVLPALESKKESFEKVVVPSSEEGNFQAEEKTNKGTVERYSVTGLVYPCFVLSAETELPKHVVSALSRMIESSLMVEDLIKVYVSNKGELLSIGGISPIQVKAVIDLLGRDTISAYYEEGYLLEGDLIYVLSS